MNVPGNGKTRAAVVAVCISAAALLVGWYGGFRAKVAREAVREERIDQHLIVAEKAMPRLDAVEKKADTADTTARANAIAIGELKVEVSRLVASQERLTTTLMDYMTRQSNRPRQAP